MRISVTGPSIPYAGQQGSWDRRRGDRVGSVESPPRAGRRRYRAGMRVVVTGEWILKATVVAIVGAILGALYPAFKAAQKDPIEALAYE